ncbi:MAG: hypothetical protein OXF27_04205 [Acidobacteria bacterium]|nr:hypothetical protein [Acidobacteriota bacterium]
MRRLLICVCASAFLLTGCESEPGGPPLEPVADVGELMRMILDPAADAVWDSSGTIITVEGTEEWEPETDEEWAVVLNGAMTIAEGANLLMIGERARDQEGWMQLSLNMSEAAMLVHEAALARDAERVFDLGETLYRSCDRCHNLYWVGDEDRGRVRDDNPDPPAP